MDFKLVLDRLLTAFRHQDIRYALIGGLALGAWGVARGTVDIDFVIHRDDRAKVDEIMQGLGYERRYCTDNVAQYLSPLRVFGEVDFFYAFRTPSLGMLERAEERKLFGGLVSIRVLRIEDLIGFKVQAIVNDEKRRSSDIADIESLLALHKAAVDWSLIEDYFNLFGLNDLFKVLKGRYGENK